MQVAPDAVHIDVNIDPLNTESTMGAVVESFSSPDLNRRERIQSFENALMGLPQVELKVRHYFAGGMYAREMFIPKGTMLTGALHLFEHINVCSQGDISVYTEDGVKRVKAPATLVCPPGSKRIGYAHEDTVWVTFHATDAKTVEEAEAKLVMATHDGLSYADAKQQIKELSQ
jgi:hypothetical protein